MVMVEILGEKRDDRKRTWMKPESSIYRLPYLMFWFLLLDYFL